MGHSKLLLREDLHSCASLSSHLLQVSGIEKLLEQLPEDIDISQETKINKFIHDWVVNTPFNVEEVEKLAKQAENGVLANNNNYTEGQDDRGNLANYPQP